MEFDKSRVYTALNADELKARDKVIVANSIGYIKDYLKKDDYEVTELTNILGEFEQERFGVGEVVRYFSLAYLVERKENCTNCGENCPRAGNTNIKENNISNCSMWKPKTEPKVKKKYRPFRDTDELIKVWCDKGGKWQKRELIMPRIWVKHKERGSQELIVAYNGDMFLTEYAQGNMEKLLEWYTFLDGSPCGVEK